MTIKNANIGTQDMSKGVLCDKPFYSLDLLTLCTSECRLFKRCRYLKKGHCKYEHRVLKMGYDLLAYAARKGLNMLQLHRASLILIPMYKDYGRLQVEIMALKTNVEEGQGGMGLVPLIDERRRMWAQIEGMLLRTGITPILAAPPPTIEALRKRTRAIKKGKGKQKKVPVPEREKDNYYDTMMKELETEE